MINQPALHLEGQTYRGEILNMHVFRNLTEVRELTEFWMTEYNDERPHDSL